MKRISVNKKTTVCYDNCLYEGASLRTWARAYARAIPEDATMIISAGASGCSIASAILVFKPLLSHVHVHPEDRISHRGSKKRLSGCSGLDNQKCIFVDDFVDTGTTVKKAIHDFLLGNKERNNIMIGLVLSGDLSHDEQDIADVLKLPIYFANKNKTILPLSWDEKNIFKKELTPESVSGNI